MTNVSTGTDDLGSPADIEASLHSCVINCLDISTLGRRSGSATLSVSRCSEAGSDSISFSRLLEDSDGTSAVFGFPLIFSS